MAHAQKPDLVFHRNGRVHLNRRGSQFSQLLAVKECGSVGRPWIDHVPRHSARVVASLSKHLFPLHFLSQASSCAITFRTASNSCFSYIHIMKVPVNKIQSCFTTCVPRFVTCSRKRKVCFLLTLFNKIISIYFK
jgi:hypothetical protein